MADAADCRGDPVSAARWLALADAAAMLSAGFDGAALVLFVARCRAMGADQPLSAAGSAHRTRVEKLHPARV